MSRLLGVKNASEYEERLIRENEAMEAVRDAERYLEWAKNTLQQ